MPIVKRLPQRGCNVVTFDNSSTPRLLQPCIISMNADIGHACGTQEEMKHLLTWHHFGETESAVSGVQRVFHSSRLLALRPASTT